MNRYAILPAAGRSRRMGQPKLRMPWGNYPTMLEATLATWEASNVTEVLVVVHPNDRELQQIVQRTTARLVIPQEAPPEMKVSIGEGLRWLAQHRTPAAEDVWLLAPADMPQFAPGIVATLVARHQQQDLSPSHSVSLSSYASRPPSIIVPRYAGRRGHPVLFPWALAAEVERLEPTEGVNSLLDRHPVLELNVEDPHILQDIDTPEDYRRFHPSGDKP
jgi:molybdenum cofactor cytidylyltransferase